jgi:glycosyltransferase involved in cell wall biosynthesis
MKAGIVIISYNNEHHIIEAINSIKNQTFKDWVCVMVDNGSTDTTYEVIQQEIAGDDRFSSRKKSNEGPAAGRNVGFSMLPDDIEYINFRDGDDVWKRN